MSSTQSCKSHDTGDNANSTVVNFPDPSGFHGKWRWQRAFRSADLPSTSKLVLFTLCSYMTDPETPKVPGSPSTSDIADDAGLGRSTARKHLKRLVEAGWLHREKVEHGDGTYSWQYYAAHPDPPQERRGDPRSNDDPSPTGATGHHYQGYKTREERSGAPAEDSDEPRNPDPPADDDPMDDQPADDEPDTADEVQSYFRQAHAREVSRGLAEKLVQKLEDKGCPDVLDYLKRREKRRGGRNIYERITLSNKALVKALVEDAPESPHGGSRGSSHQSASSDSGSKKTIGSWDEDELPAWGGSKTEGGAA